MQSLLKKHEVVEADIAAHEERVDAVARQAAAFAAAFGGTRDQLPALVQSNACTLPLLLRISPEGTPDPTPLLYNEAFTALAATSALGASCFVAAFRIAPPR